MFLDRMVRIVDGERCNVVERRRGLLKGNAVTQEVQLGLDRIPLESREPTDRAAKGCPPPFTRDRLPRPRWPAARRAAPRKVIVI
jgi:hypothetical protein